MEQKDLESGTSLSASVYPSWRVGGPWWVGSKQKLVRYPQPFWGWQGLRRRKAKEEEARESSVSSPGWGQVRPCYSHD